MFFLQLGNKIFSRDPRLGVARKIAPSAALRLRHKKGELCEELCEELCGELCEELWKERVRTLN